MDFEMEKYDDPYICTCVGKLGLNSRHHPSRAVYLSPFCSSAGYAFTRVPLHALYSETEQAAGPKKAFAVPVHRRAAASNFVIAPSIESVAGKHSLQGTTPGIWSPEKFETKLRVSGWKSISDCAERGS